MRIHADMALNDLIDQMGKRYGGSARTADIQHASDLRTLLVRDYDGQDTNAIPLPTWNAYCCAVDPDEQDE